jgi:hypothetical protein
LQEKTKNSKELVAGAITVIEDLFIMDNFKNDKDKIKYKIQAKEFISKAEEVLR